MPRGTYCMHMAIRFAGLCAAVILASGALAEPPDLVTAAGTEFAKDGRAWRFVGVNLRGLVHYGGGDGALPFTSLGHIDENLSGAANMGCRVARVFAANRNISHQAAVNRLGYALDKADQYGMKLIIALTDFYPTPFHPQGDDGYYTLNPWGWTVLNHDWFAGGYQSNYLPYVTLAVNTYKDHPAVFCWQLGNEIAAQTNADTHDAFVHAMAANIKAIDPDHMVSIGMLSLGHIPGYSTQRGIALFSDPNLDFITAHAYNGEDRVIDFAVRNSVLKPIIMSEMGCSTDVVGDRVAFMNSEIADFVTSQGARGFMHWGYQAQAFDIGDGDNYFGFDRYAHGDYNAMYAMYQGHATALNAYDEPIEPLVLPRGRNVAFNAVAWNADTYFSSQYGGEYAYDGEASTKWASTDASSVHWLAVDLGAEYVLTGYIVRLAGWSGEFAFFNHQHYLLQTGPSMSGPWTTGFDVDNSQQLNETVSVYDTPVRARFVRVYIDDCGFDNYARLPELEVYGDVTPLADLDVDGDVDLKDVAALQLCFSGPGNAHPGQLGEIDCAAANIDIGGDDPIGGDVDAQDAELLLECLTGPGATVSLSCY